MYVFENDSFSRIIIGVSAMDTTLTITFTEHNRFPQCGSGDVFPVTLEDTSGWEIMLCTNRVENVLTVVRGVEDTAPRGFAVGTRVQARVTREMMRSFVQRGEILREFVSDEDAYQNGVPLYGGYTNNGLLLFRRT